MKKKTHKEMTDIEKARINRKKQIILMKKKKIKKFLLIVFVIFFALTIIRPIKISNFLFHSVKSVLHKPNFPLKTNNNNNNKSIKEFNGDLIILSNNDITILNDNGYVLSKFNHNFSNPLLYINDNRLIVYQDFSNHIFVYDKYMDFKKIELTDKISSASISKDGKIAYVTNSDKYLSEVVILNKDGKEIYRWYNAYEYIISVEFSNNSNEAYVNSIITKDGILNSVIYRINFSKTKEVMKVNIPDFIAVDFIIGTNFVTIIGDSKIIKISNNGNILKEVSYNNLSLLNYDINGNDIVIATVGVPNSNLYNISVFDINLNQVSSFSHENNLSDIILSDRNIYLLVDNNIIKSGIDGKKISNKIISFNVDSIIYVKKSLFLMTKSYIERISF